MARRGDYDWIDDAFDEKKAAEELEAAQGSSGLGCALVIAVVLVVAFTVFSLVGLAGALGSL